MNENYTYLSFKINKCTFINGTSNVCANETEIATFFNDNGGILILN